MRPQTALGLLVSLTMLGCFSDPVLGPDSGDATSSTGDGDGDPTGDGDGDPATGDGDGDPATGDGDGDPTGDGDGDPTGDGDGDPTGDGDGDPEPPPNLLGNPSFEVWAGALPPPWTVTGAMLEMSGEASEGEASAIVTAPTYESLSQTINFPQGLPAGTCVRGGMTIRYISGEATAPGFLFTAFYEMGDELLGQQVAWIADFEWHAAETGQIVLPETTYSINLILGNTAAEPHSYGIDEVWLRVEACE